MSPKGDTDFSTFTTALIAENVGRLNDGKRTVRFPTHLPSPQGKVMTEKHLRIKDNFKEIKKADPAKEEAKKRIFDPKSANHTVESTSPS